jgi:hypothetical protein
MDPLESLAEPVVKLLLERSWFGFFFGSGVAFFGSIAAGAAVAARAVCTAAMFTALFGMSHLESFDPLPLIAWKAF